MQKIVNMQISNNKKITSNKVRFIKLKKIRKYSNFLKKVSNNRRINKNRRNLNIKKKKILNTYFSAKNLNTKLENREIF